MTLRDLPGVLEIEKAAFPDAWRREHFEKILRSANTSARVAAWNRQIVGFIVLSSHFGSAHIMNMAVHAAYRRQGIGTALVEEAERIARYLELDGLRLEVRESNLTAQVFYRSVGFRAVDILPSFYVRSGEDALLMERPV